MASVLETLWKILDSPLYWWLIYLGFCLILSVLELRWPAQRGHTAAGKIRNLGYSLIFVVFGSLCVYFLIQITGGIRRAPLPEQDLFGSVFAVISTLFIGDFIYYWYHRAQHRFGWLWALHELHHADTELNVTTSRRTFFLEKPVQLFVIAFPALLLPEYIPWLSFARMGTEALAAYPFVAIGWLVFAHANIRLSLGRLTLVATGPQFHRIHHSNQPEHRDKNFAQFFPVFDQLFGTCVMPRTNEFPDTGTPHLESDAAILNTQLRPFKIWLGKG